MCLLAEPDRFIIDFSSFPYLTIIFKKTGLQCEFIWTFYLYMEFVFIVVLYDCRTIRESIKYRAQPSSSFHIGTGSCWISNMSALRKVVGVSGRSWLHIYTIYIHTKPLPLICCHSDHFHSELNYSEINLQDFYGMPWVRQPGVYVQIKLKRGNTTSWLKGKSD